MKDIITGDLTIESRKTTVGVLRDIAAKKRAMFDGRTWPLTEACEVSSYIDWLELIANDIEKELR